MLSMVRYLWRMPTQEQHGGGRPVALVGFMGAGKSVCGQLLAQALRQPFVDLDAAIEQRVGCSIAKVFANHREPYFRAQEQHTLRAVLADGAPLVLATGGGTFCQVAARRLLLRHTETVFLRTPFAMALQRARREHKARPLLRQGPAALAGLFASRAQHYAQAQWTVDTGSQNPQQVVSRIVALLRREVPPLEPRL